jgi:SAM-dependent methyltransferase
MWHRGWDKVFKNSRFGRYPPEELVRFMARNFYDVPDRSKIAVLEVGCGPGANIWYVAREGFAAFGIDGSKVALDRARIRFLEENVVVDLCQADALDMPYQDKIFDAVFELECVYSNNILDSKKIISEVHRVLKPDGLFFSKTFAAGSDGDGSETYVDKNFKHIDIKDKVLLEGDGVVRFTSEDQIRDLYGIFKSIQYDYLIRSDSYRKREFREWLITCKK